MRKLMIAIALSLATLTANASPYDGLYAVPSYAAYIEGAADVTVAQGTTFLNIFELEDGTIVMTLLNPHTNDWQAYQGALRDNVMTLTNLYSRTDYGHKNLFKEQEIRLEFNLNSTGGVFNHTLIANPNRVISGSGRLEIIKQIKLTKVSSTAGGGVIP